MPIFDVDIRGSKYEIDAPDEAQAATQVLKLSQEPQHREFDGTNVPGYDPATGIVSGGSVDDKVGNQYGAGVRRAAESAVGLPGDVMAFGGRAANWAAEKLGAEPSSAPLVAPGLPIGLPTTEDVRSLTNEAFGEPDAPLTTKGDYARTIGEFAGGALAPGGPVRKGLSMVLPGVMSETAGQATESTPLEPYARFGAGLLGGGLTVPKIRSAPGAKLPTAAEIKQSAGYADLKAPMQAATVNKDTYGGIVKELRAVADDFGMVPEKHGAFKTILLRHGQKSQKDGASMQDLEILRRSLQHAGKDPMNPSAGELSRKLVDKLDESMEGVSSGNVVAAEGAAADETLAALKNARSTWQTGSKAGLIEKAMEKAKDTASGFENGLRIEFRKLLSNEKLSRQFTPTEKLALQTVVRGTTKSNMLRLLGGFGVPLDNARGFLGSVIGGGVGGSIGSAVGGPMGAMIGGPLLMGLGTAAKAGANAATRGHAELAEALVKAGPKAGEVFEKALAADKEGAQQALLRAFLQGQSALTQLQSRQSQ